MNILEERQGGVRMTTRPIEQDELFVDVLDDLSELEAIATACEIDRRKGKRLSHLLRKLLIDGTLQRAATALGIRLRIPSTDELPSDAELQAKHAVFTHATEVCWRGVHQCRAAIYKGPTAPEMNWGASGTPLTVDGFLSQRVMAWGPYSIQRRDMISYVANKLGGVHFDVRRKGRAQQILDHLRERIFATFHDGGIGYTIAVESALHRANARRQMVMASTHLDPSMMELFAVAGHLLHAPSVIKLKGAIQKAMPMYT